MFLDEELEQIYNRWSPITDENSAIDCSFELMEACLKRVKITDREITKKDLMEYPAVIKQVDNSYRLFHKRVKPIFNVDMFRLFYYGLQSDDENCRKSCEKLYRKIGWEIPEL